MISIVLPSNIAGHNWLDALVSRLLPPDRDPDVLIDFGNVTFVRPSGLAHVFVLIFTLLQQGYHVRISEGAGAVRSYMRRAHFWQTLQDCGAIIPREWLGYNAGRSVSLIECRMVAATTDITTLMRLSDELADQFQRALSGLGLDGKASSVWTELCGNAAEHSLSEHGSFVVAQVYAGTEIEVAIADVGQGIFSSLQHLGQYHDDLSAVMGAIEHGVTGRRDAGGRPRHGGIGLWIVRSDADRMMIRSGAALAQNQSGRRDAEDLLILDPTPCYPLEGTIVTANIFSG